MLKDEALSYYYLNKDRWETESVDPPKAIKKYFEGPERERLKQEEWSRLTLQKVIDDPKNLDKSLRECLEIMLNELQKLFYCLPEIMRNDIYYQHKLVKATRTHPSCDWATAQPPSTLTGLIQSLRTNVGQYQDRKQVVAQNRTESKPVDTYYTDRRYHKFRSKSPYRNRRTRKFRDPRRNKRCYVCNKIGCYSTKHTQEERDEAKKRYLNRVDQYLADYEGANDEDSETQIDIDTPTHEPPRRRNWAATDIKVLQESLSQLIAPRLVNASKSYIELSTVAFTAAIRKAVDQSVPWARPSAWSNPDFTPECKEAVRTCRQLRRQFSNTHNPWIWRAYLRARNKKKRLVKKSLRLGHRRRVQQATEQGPLGLWKLAKWARSRNGAYESGITPTLQDLDGYIAETVEAKTQLLREAFFPAIPNADLSDITDSQYPSQIEFPEIPRHEIEYVIRSTPPDKAPGEDGIPNSF
ncbi:hypothetical protein TSTA_010790 [Talaromyces stipitatus ATCC 10500]|uniref:Reverse transcriptase n=1 Tax=Talaromyces stipitatus (strain ATCC 10500 / CBS 375.48 / QM 6759 / NRRL 1006) TaxID=441959 RepID=B8MHI2_TALSN|nr:uncharacterized protein TSTA_010790 [Talaromyces stipitatus ATCC 10500]EED15963.1 hypothetical protein TSTA_010790 [Talaromyces stipitatus ATCC 10500]